VGLKCQGCSEGVEACCDGSAAPPSRPPIWKGNPAVEAQAVVGEKRCIGLDFAGGLQARLSTKAARAAASTGVSQVVRGQASRARRISRLAPSRCNRATDGKRPLADLAERSRLKRQSNRRRAGNQAFKVNSRGAAGRGIRPWSAHANGSRTAWTIGWASSRWAASAVTEAGRSWRSIAEVAARLLSIADYSIKARAAAAPGGIQNLFEADFTAVGVALRSAWMWRRVFADQLALIALAGSAFDWRCGPGSDRGGWRCLHTMSTG